MSGMSVSGVGGSCTAVSSAKEQQAMADVLRKERESQPDLSEMMKEARERAEEREEMFQLPKNSRRYGDVTIIAYSKLARARSLGEVDAASGYARRQMAQLRAAKRSDSDNADRIQAAINQLQRAVNRAGRKKREISQENLTAKRQARLEREKRTREAKRLRHQLKNRQMMRTIRESSYLQEADTDNRLQDQLAASKLELRAQVQELMDQTKVSVESAVQQYAAASAQPVQGPEISVEA